MLRLQGLLKAALSGGGSSASRAVRGSAADLACAWAGTQHNPCGSTGQGVAELMESVSSTGLRGFFTSPPQGIKVPMGGKDGPAETAGVGQDGPPNMSDYLDKDKVYPDTITTLAEGGLGVPVRGDIRQRTVSHGNQPTVNPRVLQHGSSVSQVPPHPIDAPGAPPPPLPDELHGMAPVHVIKKPTESMKHALKEAEHVRRVTMPGFDVRVPPMETHVYEMPDIARSPGSCFAELYTETGRNVEAESRPEWAIGSGAGHSGEELMRAGVFDYTPSIMHAQDSVAHDQPA